MNAQDSKVITIADNQINKIPGAEYFIKFRFCQKQDTEWEKAGYEVASEQFKLSDSAKPVFKAGEGSIDLIETDDAYLVKGSQFEASFQSSRERSLLIH